MFDGEEEKFKAKDSFHNQMSLKLFNLKIQIVYNNYMAVATFANIDDSPSADDRKDEQLLAARYFFS